MMLAVRTGWDPKRIGDMADPFRRACQWALYAEMVAPALSKLDEVAVAQVSPQMAPDTIRGLLKAKAEATTLAADLRAVLFPEGD